MRKAVMHIMLGTVLLGKAAMAQGLPFGAAPQAEVEFLPGWRAEDGSYVTALRFTLAPGWKTYWRAPGEAGIPPEFDWSASENIGEVRIEWPAPQLFETYGTTVVGYKEEVVLPVVITPRAAGPVRVDAQVSFGICEDICVPSQGSFTASLSGEGMQDARIVEALAERAQPGAGNTYSCRITPGEDGALHIEAEVAGGTAPHAVFEYAQGDAWITAAQIASRDGRMSVTADLYLDEAAAPLVETDRLRLTLLDGRSAIEYLGCAG